MIRLIMAFSLMGTVVLIGVCSFSFETAKTIMTQNTTELGTLSVEARYETEDLHMQGETVRDMFRGEIIGKSIQILRSHGKSDEEIKEMMLNDFSINETSLDNLLSAQEK